MPVDKEELRKAIDAFSDDDFVTSQEILMKQFKTAKNEYLQNKLDLETDPEAFDVEGEEEE